MAIKLTAFEQEQAECAKKISEYKLKSEANIVASIFKNPELIYNIDLKLEDFSHNIWKCWFAVANGLVIKEKKLGLDEITVGIYLEKHPKLKDKIQEYGGYSTIHDATAYIDLENFDSYVNDIKKFNVLLQLLKYGFPISEKLSEYIDKTSDEIYSELELMLNHTFLNAESGIQSYNAFDNIHQYIDELNEGADIGLPFYGADLLNAETAGMRLGTMTGLGGLSGCVDKDTEYFNGIEWKPISKYKLGEKVLQYNKDGTAELVYPLNYIKDYCDKMYKIKSKYGVSQMLSPEHTVVYKSKRNNLMQISAEEMYHRHIENKIGFTGKFITTFNYNGQGINLTDAEIKLMCAVICDGSFSKNETNYCRFHLKKNRKKERLREILSECNLTWKESISKTEGYIDFYCYPPLKIKEFTSEWYNCNQHQLQIICDNILFWDGSETNGRKTFNTSIKTTADFIQFAFASTGHRATIMVNDRRGRIRKVGDKEYIQKSVEYCISITDRVLCSISGNSKSKIDIVTPQDGMKYCFTVPSHMLVLRKDGRIFITGNSGKSLLAFNYIIPSAIENNFPTVFIINEEDEKRYKKEMIIWVANNIFNANVSKYQLRNGHFGEELMKIFQQCADWIEEKKEQHILTIVPLQTYSVNIAIKVIKKYARIGVQYFVLDTMKPSANAKGEIYQSMMSDAVALYDVIKPTSLNVHLLCTYQLNKASSKIRKLTSDNIGMSKSIVDVMSLNIMVRHPHADEFDGESHALKCYRLNKKTKIPFALDKNKSYLILFITKNRFGRANHQQIIAEFDMGTNKYHEVGYTIIMEDF